MMDTKPTNVHNVKSVLQELHAVTSRAVAILECGDPDPDEVTQIMERRTALFEILQEFGYDATDWSPDERALASELIDLHRRCISSAEKHLDQLRGELHQVEVQRRSLTAYGGVDSHNAPRGAFLDTTLD